MEKEANKFYKYLTGRVDQQTLNSMEGDSDFSEKRKAAWLFFKEQGLPTKKNEDWKFTNLHLKLSDVYNIELPDIKIGRFPFIDSIDACRIVLVNGRLNKELSDELPEGITYLDTKDALSRAEVSKKVGSIANTYENGILALNMALFNQLHVLYVSPKAIVSRPVHVYHTYAEEGNSLFVPYRMLVVAGKQSEATLVESFHSDIQHPFFVSYVSEQELDEAAIFHSHISNTAGPNVNLVHHREIVQQANSVLNNSNIMLGSATLIRNDINFRLKGSNSEANMIGAYVVSDNQHVDNHTIVDHQVPNCNTSELYKGILLDRSNAVFNGKVFVRPDAQKTNAFQQNNNLLLSDEATVDSKPQLEIFADDVKCSHGSTIGQMNKDALFYLKSRGIGDEAAKRLLMEAFIYDVLAQIEVEGIRTYSEALLEGKFEKLEFHTI